MYLTYPNQTAEVVAPLFHIYNEALAIQDIYAMQATDCSVDAMTAWNCGLACNNLHLKNTRVIEDKRAETLMLAGIHDGGCEIIFRGSKTPKNYLQDANIMTTNFPSDAPKSKVHKGFLKIWQALKPAVLNVLHNDLRCGDLSKGLSIVGHSMGASIATIAAVDLAAEFKLNRIYTYGQPRTGNAAFGTAFHEKIGNIPFFRVVDFMDVIPHLPPAYLLGYVHLEPEVYYSATKLGAHHTCASALDRSCSNQWSFLQASSHGCDHCSYLGLNPCHCGAPAADCIEG